MRPLESASTTRLRVQGREVLMFSTNNYLGLTTHPKVKEAVVVGVPDPYRGETVKAFVVLQDGSRVSAEEIMAFCRERLAAYKVPRQVVFRDSLPKSGVGKYLRRELKNM